MPDQGDIFNLSSLSLLETSPAVKFQGKSSPAPKTVQAIAGFAPDLVDIIVPAAAPLQQSTPVARGAFRGTHQTFSQCSSRIWWMALNRIPSFFARERRPPFYGRCIARRLLVLEQELHKVQVAMSIAPTTITIEAGSRCASPCSLRKRELHRMVMTVLSLNSVVTYPTKPRLYAV